MANTALIGLTLPAQGTLSGQWGDTVNNAISQIVDVAVAGTQNLTTDADVTLSVTTGTYATTGLTGTSSQYAVILWTAGGTDTRTITVPAQSKTYVVVNKTSGTQSIIIQGTTGTGVTVPAGGKALVAWDGTNFVQVSSDNVGVSSISFGSTGLTPSTDTAGVVTVAGTLASASGGTGLSSPGTSGNVLLSNGDVWTSAPAPAGGIEYVLETSNYTASDKQGVLADTSGGSFTVTLPATPASGEQVVVADPTGDWGTNNLTVGRNGSTISGVAEDLICDIASVSVQLVYDGTTWNVYAQVGGNGGTAVTLAGVQTLTNKTITYADNTLTGVVGESATQTLTNKTIESGLLTNGYTETVFTLGTSGTLAFESANGSIQSCTLTGDPTFTDLLSTGQSIVLRLVNGASYTVTWPTINWVTSGGNVAPTLTAADTLVFWNIGGTLYGAYVGSYA